MSQIAHAFAPDGSPLCLSSSLDRNTVNCLDFRFRDEVNNFDYNIFGPQYDPCTKGCFVTSQPRWNSFGAPKYNKGAPSIQVLRYMRPSQSQTVSAVLRFAHYSYAAGILFFPAYGAELSEIGLGAVISKVDGQLFGVTATLRSGFLTQQGCSCEIGFAAGMNILTVKAHHPDWIDPTWSVETGAARLVTTSTLDWTSLKCKIICECSRPMTWGVPFGLSVTQLLDEDPSGRTYHIRAEAGNASYQPGKFFSAGRRSPSAGLAGGGMVEQTVVFPTPLPCGKPALVTRTFGAAVHWSYPKAENLNPDDCGSEPPPEEPPVVEFSTEVDCADILMMADAGQPIDSIRYRVARADDPEFEDEVFDSGWVDPSYLPEDFGPSTTVFHLQRGVGYGNFLVRMEVEIGEETYVSEDLPVTTEWSWECSCRKNPAVFTLPDCPEPTVDELESEPVLFPYSPNWQQGIKNEYQYLTDVIESQTGRESRISLRDTPNHFVEYAPVMIDEGEAEQLNGLLWASGNERWLVPIWLDKISLTEAYSMGAESTPLPDSVADGDLVMIWRSSVDWEVKEVAAGAYTEPLDRDWAAGSVVVPLRYGRMVSEAAMERPSASTASMVVRFQLEVV